MSLTSPKAPFLSHLAMPLLLGAWVVVLAVAGAWAGESASREDFRKELNLVYNHPNPFNPSTTINYVLLQPAEVTVDVFDLRGRHMARLVDSYQEEGENFAVWKTLTAPSGTYIFRLEADEVQVFRKMMLVR